MSDSGIQTDHGGDAKIREFTHPRRSTWMSHWMRTSNSALHVNGHLSFHSGSREKECDYNHDQSPVVVHDEVKSSKHTRLSINAAPSDIFESRNSCRLRLGDINVDSNVPLSAEVVGADEGRRVEITNETQEMNSSNSRTTRLELHPDTILNFSDSNLAQKKGPVLSDEDASKAETDDRSRHGSSTMGSTDPRFPLRMLRLTSSGTELCYGKGRSESLGQSAKPSKGIAGKSLPIPMPFRDRLSGLTSSCVPLNSRGIRIQSSCRKEEIDSLACEEKNDVQLVSRPSRNSNSGKKDGAVQLCDPSTSHLPLVVGAQGKRLHGFNSARLLPSISCPVEVSRLETLSHGCCSSSQIMVSGHNVDKVQESTPVNTLMGAAVGHPKSFQSTHLFNETSGNHVFGEATSPSKSSESASPKLFTLLPRFDFLDICGEKLQATGSSTSSQDEPIGATTAFLGLKNESSAETDIMDINFALKRKFLPSNGTSTSDKLAQNVIVDQNPTLSPSTNSLLVGSKMTETKSPGIYREPPSSIVATENMDLCGGETQNLDVEHHVEKVGISSCSPQKYTSLGPEQRNRGVKRLKSSLFASHANVTKCMKIGDSSSSELVNSLYSKVMNCSRTSSGPSFGSLLDKGQASLDKSVSLENKESSLMYSVTESSWIQRWCNVSQKAPVTEMKSVAEVAREPESTSMALDEFQSKQFPSLGAMALLGKAMNGFQPCKYQNRGSFVVWTTG